jgi:hypothetical protein
VYVDPGVHAAKKAGGTKHALVTYTRGLGDLRDGVTFYG